MLDADDMREALQDLIRAKDEEGFKRYLEARDIPSEVLNKHVHAVTLLDVAIESESLNMARWLIDAGASVHLKDPSFGMTALHLAAGSGYADGVQMLISAGACLNEVDKSGQAALHFAVKGGSLNAVKILVAAGADIDKKENQNLTALNYARLRYHKEMILFLAAAMLVKREKEVLEQCLPRVLTSDKSDKTKPLSL